VDGDNTQCGVAVLRRVIVPDYLHGTARSWPSDYFRGRRMGILENRDGFFTLIILHSRLALAIRTA
jgi:hypothetical protein